MGSALLSFFCRWAPFSGLPAPAGVLRVSHRAGAGWFRICAAALLTLAFEPVVAAEGPVRERNVVEWLLRMHEASRQRAYMGTLVVSSGSAISSSRIWHVCDGKQQLERVDTLTGEPRTTIRRNSEVITFVPSSKQALVERRESLGIFPELLRTPSHQIATFYDAADRGTERVAGHLADVITIMPRDGLRFGYRVWSEQKTGLVVKMQTLGEQGAVLEQVGFTELQLDAPVRMEQLIQQMSNTKGYDLRRTVLQKTTPLAEGWQLKDTVPGFTTMSCHTRSAATSGRAPMQWVLSDGLATVSLFIEPFDAARHQKEVSAVMGATHSVSQRLGDYWLTAMGEVPPITLKRFVAALERVR